MKVLIGVDGSPNALAAVRMAARLLDPERDRLAFYFSVAYPASKLAVPHQKALVEAWETLGDEVFDAARAALPAEFHPQLETFLGKERPHQGLLTTADAWQAELLVLGARGRSPLAQMLLGSTARRVAHSTRRPVLVVRGEQPKDSALRVALAYDEELNQSSRAAVEFLPRLTFPADAEGLVASVIEPYHAEHFPRWLQSRPRNPEIEELTEAWGREYHQACEARQQELVELTQRLPTVFQKLPPVVAQGHPAEQLLKLIEQEQVDLIVLGAGRSTAMARLVVGSVSDTVLTYAECSVLLVHKT